MENKSKKIIYPYIETSEVSEIIKAVRSNNEKGETYKLPRFQRGSVWNSSQRTKLIESMKKGWPIGSIMLAKEVGQEKKPDYIIIDGQQRVRTLLDYTDKKIKYFNFEDLAKKIYDYIKLNKIIHKNKLVAEETDVVIEIQSILRTMGDLNYMEIPEILERKKIIIEVMGSFKKDLKPLLAKLDEIIKEEEKIQDIENYKISIIKFNGDDDDLPQVFELINTRGTKLNKYDILSARWSSEELRINDEEIMNELKLMYDNRKEGIDILNYDSRTFKKSPINLAEYFIGFGMKLGKKYPSLFGTEKQSEDVGFKAFLTIFKENIQKTNDLKKIFNERKLIENGGLDSLQKKIEESIDFVYKNLQPYLEFTLNKKYINSHRICHAHTQIMAFIGTVFNEKFDIDNNFEEKKNWKISKRILERNLSLYFIKDILQGVWDSKHPEEKVKERIESRFYLDEITKEKWENAFENYLSIALEKNYFDPSARSREVIRPADKLFLTFMYIRSKTKSKGDLRYEIEHIVPRERLKKRLINLNINSAPIDSICNLGLITSEINGKKQDLTIVEFLQKKGLDEDIKNLAEYDKKNLFIEGLEESLILPNLKGIDNFAYSWFEEFLKKRFELLKKEFYKVYEIN